MSSLKSRLWLQAPWITLGLTALLFSFPTYDAHRSGREVLWLLGIFGLVTILVAVVLRINGRPVRPLMFLGVSAAIIGSVAGIFVSSLAII